MTKDSSTTKPSVLESVAQEIYKDAPKYPKTLRKAMRTLRETVVALEERSRTSRLSKKRHEVLNSISEVSEAVADVRAVMVSVRVRDPVINKLLKYISNVAISMHDGVEDKSMGKAGLKSTLALLVRTAIKGEKTSAVIALDTQIKAASEMVTHKAVAPELSKTDVREQRLDHMQDEHKEMMRVYSKHLAKLPAKLRTSYDVMEMPVVPMFEDFNIVTDKALDGLGIKYKSFDGLFHVLEKQILLVFRKEEATTYTTTTKGGKLRTKQAGSGTKVKADRTARKQNIRQNIIQDNLNNILENEINPAMHKEYALVSVFFPTSPKNKNIMFAWIMPKDKLRRFMRNANDNSGMRGKWGFPWDQNKMTNGGG